LAFEHEKLPPLIAFVIILSWLFTLRTFVLRVRQTNFFESFTYFRVLGITALIGLFTLPNLRFEQRDFVSSVKIQHVRSGIDPNISIVADFLRFIYSLHLSGTSGSKNTSAESLASVLTKRNELALTKTRLSDKINRPSIILISVESLRPDAPSMKCENRPVMPFLRRFIEESISFTRAYAPSSHSDYSDPSIYSSRLPIFGSEHVYFSPGDTWPRPTIHSLIKDEGYIVAHFSSQNEAWGGMKYFFPNGLDAFFEPESVSPIVTLPIDAQDSGAYRAFKSGVLKRGSIDDSVTIDEAIKWIQRRKGNNRPIGLSINLQATHFPYKLPAKTLPLCGESNLTSRDTFANYPLASVPEVSKSYKNALNYVDNQLAKLIRYS
jgi:hypothetical protein